MKENIIIVPDSAIPTFHAPVTDEARSIELDKTGVDTSVRLLIRSLSPRISPDVLEQAMSDILDSNTQGSQTVAVGAWVGESLCGFGIGEIVDSTVHVKNLALNPARQNAGDRARLILRGMASQAKATHLSLACREQDERFFAELFRSEPIKFVDEDGDNLAVFVTSVE